MQNKPDSEIDLSEYLEILIKRKMTVCSITLAAMLPVALWSYFSSNIYEISMIIEPPISAVTDTGVQGWDSVMNIKSKIEADAYADAILGDLKLQEDLPQFSIVIPKDTRMVKIRLKSPADRLDLSETIMSKLLEKIHGDYASVIDDKRAKIDNQIGVVRSQIHTKENEIRLKAEQFKILDARERQFVEDIKLIHAHSDRLAAKSESVFEKEEAKGDFAVLYYAATLHQNASALARLHTDLSELKSRKESTLNEIEDLKNAIGESRIHIQDLNMSKGGVQNIHVIQKPRRSTKPVGPRRRRNVLLAGFAGLLIGACCALLVESWKNTSA